MTGDALMQALHADAPEGEAAETLRLFGQFVGSWDVAWSGLGPDGSALTLQGELHFGWVLGGRAIQDVWIVPRADMARAGEKGLAFHGSTIRFYDAAIGAWRSTWIEPVNGRVRRFIGRPEGASIVLLSDEDHPQLRWSFDLITPTSFRWRGEASEDAGSTWVLEEQMLLTRMSATEAASTD